MLTTLTRAAGFALALALASAASAGNSVLLGVASYAPFTQQGLYRIDASTGAATLIANTGLVNINGISFDTVTGTLYAYTTAADLYKIDVNTGAATLLAQVNATVPEGDLAMTSPASAFAVNAGLFGAISITTGVFAPIGLLGPAGDDISGLALDATGAVFGYAKNGTNADTIVTINPLTGLATTLGPTGFNAASAVGALAFDPAASAMYLSDGANLRLVNTSTGEATLIGAHGVNHLSGLAIIPSPAATGLALVALVGSLRRRR
jgi:hypothetical protein